MKTETFKGKNKQDLDKKIWDWKLTNGNFVVKKTPLLRLTMQLPSVLIATRHRT
jgi:hypothetical protein